jgi:hypothetical protein
MNRLQSALVRGAPVAVTALYGAWWITAHAGGGRASVHTLWQSLAELRRRQQDPDGRAELRERVAVEHALAHVGHWQGRRARYLGTRKNLFDLRRVAVVHNLHVIARQTLTDGYQLAA